MFNSRVCDSESQEIYFSFSKLEFFGIECAATASSSFEKVTYPVEVVFYVVIINYGVIHACFAVFKSCHDFCFPVSVPIACTYQTLRCCAVPIPAPHGEKSSQVAVCWVQRHAVIAMPAVYHGLDLVAGYGRHDGPGALSVMCLSWGKSVKGSKVNHSPWAAICFRGDNHPTCPGDRIIHRDFF